MKCNNCKKEVDDKNAYCPLCGTKLEKSSVKKCSKCNQAIDSNNKYCTHCGTQIDEEQDKTLPVILAIGSNCLLLIGVFTWKYSLYLIGLVMAIVLRIKYPKVILVKVNLVLYIIATILIVAFIVLMLYLCSVFGRAWAG